MEQIQRKNAMKKIQNINLKTTIEKKNLRDSFEHRITDKVHLTNET